MAKLTLSDVSNILGNPSSAQATINANNDAIEVVMENTLSRDGTTPNQMLSDLDMNHYDVLNAGLIDAADIIVDGTSLIDAVDRAEDAADRAEAAARDGLSTSILYYDRVVDGPLVQRKLMEPFFGFNNGSTNTEIFTNSQFAIQGHCILDTPLGTRLFVTQRTTGATWGPDERCRIVEFALRTDGGVGNHISFSSELEIGHGANLSGIVVGGQVILFCSASPVSGGTTEGSGGKGYTKIIWNGAATTQANVTTYRVFSKAGEGARDIYRYATVGVSPNGLHVALIARNSQDTGRFLFIFDRAEVEASGTPSSVPTIAGPVALVEGLGEYGGSCQGVAVDNESIVYTIWGATGPRTIKTLNLYDYGGTLLRQCIIDGPASQYTEAQVNYDATLKYPVSFEPEGVSIYGKSLITGWIDSWREAPVVSYRGKNYACIATTSLGVYPQNRTNWLPTTRPTTLGAFNPATSYSGGNHTRRSKAIYEVSAIGTGQPLTSGKHDPSSGARLVSFSGAPDVTFMYGSQFQIAANVEGLNTNLTSLAIDNSTFRFYSNSLDYSGQFTTLTRYRDAVDDYSEIIANGTLRTNSPYILMYGSSDTNQPGEVRISSWGTASVRLLIAGISKFVINATDNVSYQLIRPLNDLAIDFGTNTRRWLTGYFGSLVVGSTGNAGFDSSGGLKTQSATGAQILSITDPVNTTNKYPGKTIYDSTNLRLMVAAGFSAGSSWRVCDNSATVTPV